MTHMQKWSEGVTTVNAGIWCSQQVIGPALIIPSKLKVMAYNHAVLFFYNPNFRYSRWAVYPMVHFENIHPHLRVRFRVVCSITWQKREDVRAREEVPLLVISTKSCTAFREALFCLATLVLGLPLPIWIVKSELADRELVYPICHLYKILAYPQLSIFFCVKDQKVCQRRWNMLHIIKWIRSICLIIYLILFLYLWSIVLKRQNSSYYEMVYADKGNTQKANKGEKASGIYFPIPASQVRSPSLSYYLYINSSWRRLWVLFESVKNTDARVKGLLGRVFFWWSVVKLKDEPLRSGSWLECISFPLQRLFQANKSQRPDHLKRTPKIPFHLTVSIFKASFAYVLHPANNGISILAL